MFHVCLQDSEPEIYKAIRFGAVLENVAFDDNTREVDYEAKWEHYLALFQDNSTYSKP